MASQSLCFDSSISVGPSSTVNKSRSRYTLSVELPVYLRIGSPASHGRSNAPSDASWMPTTTAAYTKLSTTLPLGGVVYSAASLLAAL